MIDKQKIREMEQSKLGQGFRIVVQLIIIGCALYFIGWIWYHLIFK